MKIRSFRFPALGQQKWTVDADTVIKGVYVTITSVISTDPSLTVGNFEVTAAQTQDDDLKIYTKSNSSVGLSLGNLNVPLSRGQDIYVASSGPGNCQLYLEDPVS